MEFLNKRTLFIVLDILLLVYLGMAMTSFNHEATNGEECEEVNIKVSDKNNDGFLSAEDIKKILNVENLYPKGYMMRDINPRAIEETLKKNPYINGAQCSKTRNGKVNIEVTQRVPGVHIMSENGEDYYVDEMDSIMPSSNFTSNLIIATGNISKWYAQNYVATACRFINADETWREQIEQINILPDKNMELVPRMGNHIVNIGRLPEYTDKEKRIDGINKFLKKKLERLDKFYRYGLSQAGWNKYAYISLEFDNQIICKKHRKEDIIAITPAKDEKPAEEVKEQGTKKEKTSPSSLKGKEQEGKKQEAKKEDKKTTG